MNPYLLAGLAAVAFFVLRGQQQTVSPIEPIGGGGGGQNANRPAVGGGEYGGILFSGAEDAFERAILDAIERGKKEAAARREQVATVRSEQSTSLADLGTGATVKRFAVSGSSTRSMTDFGV